MPSWLPSIPYPAPKEGYWEPVTSTLNWCEEDYYATKYSAEIVNTLTNLLFQYLAIKGGYNCIRNDHDRIFLVTFVGYFLVGTGSFLFHSTLKYPMQLVDELSMIYTTCLMCFATFAHRKRATTQFVLAFLLIALSVFITGYYHYLQDPAFHQAAYAILTAIVLFRSMFIMEVNLRPAWRKPGGIFPSAEMMRARSGSTVEERIRQEQRDEEIVGLMWTLIATGLGVFLGGFGLWTIDNEFCGLLRSWRHSLGLPWGILLEGHGWWHLMTGTGAYFYIVWGIWLRHCLNGKQDEYELRWPSLFTSLPVVVKIQSETHQNGSAKKTI